MPTTAKIIAFIQEFPKSANQAGFLHNNPLPITAFHLLHPILQLLPRLLVFRPIILQPPVISPHTKE
jgi:hypothetical protein